MRISDSRLRHPERGPAIFTALTDGQLAHLVAVLRSGQLTLRERRPHRAVDRDITMLLHDIADAWAFRHWPAPDGEGR